MAERGEAWQRRGGVTADNDSKWVVKWVNKTGWVTWIMGQYLQPIGP